MVVVTCGELFPPNLCSVCLVRAHEESVLTRFHWSKSELCCSAQAKTKEEDSKPVNNARFSGGWKCLLQGYTKLVLVINTECQRNFSLFTGILHRGPFLFSAVEAGSESIVRETKLHHQSEKRSMGIGLFWRNAGQLSPLMIPIDQLTLPGCSLLPKMYSIYMGGLWLCIRWYLTSHPILTLRLWLRLTGQGQSLLLGKGGTFGSLTWRACAGPG